MFLMMEIPSTTCFRCSVGITFMIMGAYTPPLMQSECYGTLSFCYALGIFGTSRRCTLPTSTYAYFAGARSNRFSRPLIFSFNITVWPCLS